MTVAKWVPVALAWCAVSAAGAGAQASAPGAAAQDIYNRGQSAYDKGDWAEAVRDFSQLLPTQPSAVQGRSQGAIAYRYADSLDRLGRAAEAQPWVARAVTELAVAEPDLAAEAWQVKAEVDRAMIDYPAATKDYLQAGELLQSKGFSAQLVDARLGAGAAGATVDAQHILPLLTGLMSDPGFIKLDKPLRASVEDVAARLATNVGDLKMATAFSRNAVRDSGGLTAFKVSPVQVSVRADAAIVARLDRRDEDAREYLTYTGAGHLTDMNWISQHTGELPVCGAATGDGNQVIQADDDVVVAFAISDQGSVDGVMPIYASRAGSVGEDFARTVADWRWDPAQIGKVPLFWRSTLQLELRCQSRPELDDFVETSYKQLVGMLNDDGLLTPVELNYASRGGKLPILKTDSRLQGPKGALLAAAVLSPRDTAAAEEAWAGLDRVHAPPVAYAVVVERLATKTCGAMCFSPGSARRAADALSLWAPRFMQRFPADPAGERLLMMESLELEIAGDFPHAEAVLTELVGRVDGERGSLTSLHALAYLHRAIGLEREGHPTAAKAMLERSGLNSDSCAIFETHPLLHGGGAGNFDFPQEAQRWGFNGVVLTDFDIKADGHVNSVRAVVSYPPFIFDEASVRGVGEFTYLAPHLGGEALGCQGEVQAIRYYSQ